MMRTLALLVLVALVAAASARPIEFVGGSFTQVKGHYSPGFAAYTEDGDRTGWSRSETPTGDWNGIIYDMYPVGEGVFAVGTFTHINDGEPSSGVAYYDGSKWCAVRQSLGFSTKRGGNVGPRAVWCDSDISCWVAGEFSSVNNVPDYLNDDFANFVHYTYDDVSNEWLFDFDVQAWNNASATDFIAVLPDTAVPGTLIGLRNTSDNNTYFFVGTGSVGSMTVHRGSQLDNGWRQLSQSHSSSVDFGFDQSVYPPIWYSLTGAAPDQELSSVWAQELLLAPCTHSNCENYILQDGFVNTAFIPRQQTTIYIQEYQSIWSYNQTRYLIAYYDPDGNAVDRDPRYQVLKQEGDNDPKPLGEPFTQSTSLDIQRVRGHPLNVDWAYVIGQVQGANLYFPPGDSEGPVSTDVSTDRRSLDHVTYIAEWRDLGRWQQAFGGGLAPFGSDPSVETLPVVWNPNSKQWFVANNELSFVYDVQANGAAYYDNEPSAGQPSIFPVFTRAIWRRPNQFQETSPNSVPGVTEARVFDLLCYSDCKNVYVGGDFSFHGNDTLGALALVRVKSSGETELQDVGGGLWYTDLNVVRDNPDLQFTAGQVYALAQADDYLYAGGYFSRAKAGYVCLNNVARIQKTTDAESEVQWEDLNGGCSDEVYDLHFWEGRLYAAGAFEWCGNHKVNFVADYTYHSGNDAAWNALNNGVDGFAYSIEEYGGRLIFAGEFNYAGGVPVTGVAAWNKVHWRPLLPACTDDCVPGTLQYYFNVLNTPSKVYNLKRDKDGNYLYARADFSPAESTSSSSSISSSGGSTSTYLARWEYFDDSDSGIWTVKGPQAQFDLVQFQKRGDGVNVNNGTFVLVGGTPSSENLYVANQAFHTWDDHSNIQNWVGTHVVIAPEIFVLRSSASSLSSPIAFLLSFF